MSAIGQASKQRTPQNVTWFTVPAGTRPTHCRGQSCGALIYFVPNPTTGRMTPISCDVEGGRRPSESKELGQLDMLSGGEAEVYDGKGISHFQNCSDADHFSGRGAQ